MSRTEGPKALGSQMRIKMKVNKRWGTHLLFPSNQLIELVPAPYVFWPNVASTHSYHSFTVALYSGSEARFASRQGYGRGFSTYNS